MNDSDKELVERAVSARDLFKHQATRHRLEQSIHNCGAIIAFWRHHEIEEARHDLRLIAGMVDPWRPIETATKHGGKVRLWAGEERIGYWMKAEYGTVFKNVSCWVDAFAKDGNREPEVIHNVTMWCPCWPGEEEPTST